MVRERERERGEKKERERGREIERRRVGWREKKDREREWDKGEERERGGGEERKRGRREREGLGEWELKSERKRERGEKIGRGNEKVRKDAVKPVLATTCLERPPVYNDHILPFLLIVHYYSCTVIVSYCISQVTNQCLIVLFYSILSWQEIGTITPYCVVILPNSQGKYLLLCFNSKLNTHSGGLSWGLSSSDRSCKITRYFQTLDIYPKARNCVFTRPIRSSQTNSQGRKPTFPRIFSRLNSPLIATVDR